MKKTILIIALVSGILLAIQVRSFKKVESLLSRSRPNDTFAELRTLQIATAALREEVKREEENLEKLNSDASQLTLEEEIGRLTLLSGAESVTGEGIEITIATAVQDFWILDLIAEMVHAGAEAVAVNDVRITPKTAGIRQVAEGFVVGKRFFKPPFRITVIGPRKEIFQLIIQRGGIIDRIENTHPGLALLVTEREKIVIPALLGEF